MNGFTLFIDEAGNTGSRYLDINQPYFILGGWFIENKNIQSLCNEIRNLEKNYSSTGFELKGKNLAKHKKGQKFVLDVCKKVAEYGGMPLMFLVEKRYMVCGKIIETYLDPFYNKLIKNEELLDLEKRQARAQEIFDTNSNLIEEFAEAYRLRKVDRVKELNLLWAKELKKLGKKELSEKILGAYDNIEEEMKIEFEVFSTHKNYDSLNLPMLVAMFQYVEANLPSPIKIIHDNTDSFKEAFNRMYDLLDNKSEKYIQYKDERRLYLGLQTINSFEFEDSKSNPLLRAADYSVSATAMFVKNIFTNNIISDTLKDIAMMSIGGILLKALSVKYPQFGFIPDLGMTFSSRDFVKKVFNKLGVPNA